MFDEFNFSKKDVCERLGISIYTLEAWYRWERMELIDDDSKKPYLPQPVKMENMKGRPQRWSLSMINILRDYQSGIIRGRNGIYGKYTNAAWH